MPSFDSSDYKSLYFQTAYKLIQDYKVSMIHLQKYQDDVNCLKDLHRIIHSLKGQTAFMMYAKTALFLKELEMVLFFLKDHSSLVSQSILSSLPQSEILFSYIKNLEEKNEEFDFEREIKQMKALIVQLSGKQSL
jgi:chemotaxis protein histidine kinase CheA